MAKNLFRSGFRQYTEAETRNQTGRLKQRQWAEPVKEVDMGAYIPDFILHLSKAVDWKKGVTAKGYGVQLKEGYF